jgi:hypothetical protein
MAPARAAVSPTRRACSRWGPPPPLDQLDICFDDTHAIANAGLLLAAALAERLGIQQAADALIDLGEGAGAAHPGPQAANPGSTRCWQVGTASTTPTCCAVAPARCWAIGSWRPPPGDLLARRHLRHIRQLAEQLLARAWAARAGPGDGPMTVDLDSTVCQVHGYHRQGAAYGHTHTLVYHLLVASHADSAQVLPRQADRWDIWLLIPTSPGPYRRRLRRPVLAGAASRAAAAR